MPPTSNPLKIRPFAFDAANDLRTSAQNGEGTCALDTWKNGGVCSSTVPTLNGFSAGPEPPPDSEKDFAASGGNRDGEKNNHPKATNLHRGNYSEPAARASGFEPVEGHADAELIALDAIYDLAAIITANAVGLMDAASVVDRIAIEFRLLAIRAALKTAIGIWREETAFPTEKGKR